MKKLSKISKIAKPKVLNLKKKSGLITFIFGIYVRCAIEYLAITRIQKRITQIALRHSKSRRVGKFVETYFQW